MLTAAVIGYGTMGRNHLRVLGELPDLAVVAVADPDPMRLAGLRGRHGVEVFTSYEELLARARPDLVVVAVPTLHHRPVVEASLRSGAHTLVEKPIAATIEDGLAMVAVARAADRLLAVGHIERFNPAIGALKRRLEAGELGRVFQATVRRLGPFPARVRDVGVVLDLATHDLDVLRYLIASPVQRIYAETERRIHTAHEDLLDGLLRFTNGVVASLSINWLTPTKVRELALTGERGMFVVDYLTQDLTFYANDYAGANWQVLETLAGVSEGSMTRYRVEKREPLRVELEQFAMAVRTWRDTAGDPPVVTAEDGLEALRLATLIVESGRSGAVIFPTGGAGLDAAPAKGGRP